MSTSIYYNYFGSESETLGLQNVIDILRNMSPTMMNATLGLCLGLSRNIEVVAEKWNGEEARDVWKVKHQASIENYIKQVAKWLPVNTALVNHIAKESFVICNRVTPSQLLDHMWYNLPADQKFAIQKQVLKSGLVDNAELEYTKSTDGVFNWSESYSMVVSEIYCGMDDILNNEDEIPTSDEIYSGLSKMMDDEKVSTYLNVEQCCRLLNQVCGQARSFHSGQIPDTDTHPFIIDKMMKEVLPANYKLSPLEIKQLCEVLSVKRDWANVA